MGNFCNTPGTGPSPSAKPNPAKKKKKITNAPFLPPAPPIPHAAHGDLFHAVTPSPPRLSLSPFGLGPSRGCLPPTSPTTERRRLPHPAGKSFFFSTSVSPPPIRISLSLSVLSFFFSRTTQASASHSPALPSRRCLFRFPRFLVVVKLLSLKFFGRCEPLPLHTQRHQSPRCILVVGGT